MNSDIKDGSSASLNLESGSELKLSEIQVSRKRRMEESEEVQLKKGKVETQTSIPDTKEIINASVDTGNKVDDQEISNGDEKEVSSDGEGEISSDGEEEIKEEKKKKQNLLFVELPLAKIIPSLDVGLFVPSISGELYCKLKDDRIVYISEMFYAGITDEEVIAACEIKSVDHKELPVGELGQGTMTLSNEQLKSDINDNLTGSISPVYKIMAMPDSLHSDLVSHKEEVIIKSNGDGKTEIKSKDDVKISDNKLDDAKKLKELYESKYKSILKGRKLTSHTLFMVECGYVGDSGISGIIHDDILDNDIKIGNAVIFASTEEAREFLRNNVVGIEEKTIDQYMRYGMKVKDRKETCEELDERFNARIRDMINKSKEMEGWEFVRRGLSSSSLWLKIDW